MTECENCAGSGVLYYPMPQYDTGQELPIDPGHPCKFCKGTGKLTEDQLKAYRRAMAE